MKQHPGGNINFWEKDEVSNFDHKQKRVVEKKEEALNNMIRIINYFCNKYTINNPKILDIGCGIGSLSIKVLDNVNNCIVHGVDSSEDMIIRANLIKDKYPEQFYSFVSNFNLNNFWITGINYNYDFIITSMALHYLSDDRRDLFFKEIYEHLVPRGIFIGLIANQSNISEIQEMERFFKVEYAFNNEKIEYESLNFDTFQDAFSERERSLNINWKSPSDYVKALYSAGFHKCDIVWHVWIKSIFLAIK